MISKTENNKIINKQVNFGFYLLKIVMCFCVICAHFYPIMPLILRNACLCAVPVFLFLTFYFAYKVFDQKNNNKFREKIKRLTFPFYFWGIFFSIFFLIINKYFNIHHISLENIFWQIATGSAETINPPLWYLFDTILLLIVFKFIFKNFSSNKITFVMSFLIIFSLFMQYSLINYKIFGNLAYGLKFTLGRLFEILPYAAMGILFSKHELFNKFKIYVPKAVKIFLGTIILIFMIFSNFSGPGKNLHFYYAGISIMIFSTFILLLFNSMKFKSEKIRTSIENFSKYTLGIYCIHYPIGILLLHFINKNTHPIFLCILIFIISGSISYLLAKNNFIKKAVV